MIGLMLTAIQSQAQSVYEPYTFTTFAGNSGPGSADGTGPVAQFHEPSGVAVDSAGNVFVADTWNNTIRKVTSAGVVTTLAGLAQFDDNGNPVGGSVEGRGSEARFHCPSGVAVDTTGNVYVADSCNHTIRKVTPSGVVMTLAGTSSIRDQFGDPVGGYADGTGSTARFWGPSGVALDSTGNVYVTDGGNNTIRKVTPTGVVTTVAGLAEIEDHGNPVGGNSDGTGNAARFSAPSGLALDRAGNVYVADTGNHTLRKVTPMGVVTTLAGFSGNPGSKDGLGNAARFNYPNGVAVDSDGNVYVADAGNHTLRKVTPAGLVTTLAGLAAQFDNIGNLLVGGAGSSEGTGSNARFFYPSGVAVDGAGNIYVADSDNNTIRKVTPVGVVTTLAGNVGHGSADGTGSAAQFGSIGSWGPGPVGVAVDTTGNLYVADTYNSTIRKVTPTGLVTTFAGLAGSSGSADGIGSDARFNNPFGLAVDNTGNIYVADTYNSTIRKVTAAGMVTTLAGDASVTNQYGFPFGGGYADGMGNAARFNYPKGVAADGAGNVFVADTYNNAIRKITPNGMVTTLAGLPPFDSNGNSMDGSVGSADGMGSDARFFLPSGVAVDSAGNIYVADSDNQEIRKVTSAGMVTTLAGLAGHHGGSADGTGANARFGRSSPGHEGPSGVAADSAGNVYVADTYNNAIRKVTPTGVVTTLAGLAGHPGSADGTGSEARFGQDSVDGPVGPFGVAVDAAGNVYVAGNNLIRKGYPALRILNSGPGFGFSGGPFGFNLTGPPGQSAILEVSANLATWWPLWTNTFAGALHFSDPQSGVSSQRFYRARLP
jgi:sugar lactone lactonase YvrE